MKNIFSIFTICLLASCNLYAQAGLTQSLQEIKKEFPGGIYDDDYNGHRIYTCYNEELYCRWIFTFDKELTCRETVVVIDEEKVVQAWIESMNEEWVVISDTEWKYYRSDGFIFSCHFSQDNDGQRGFIYSIKKTL